MRVMRVQLVCLPVGVGLPSRLHGLFRLRCTRRTPTQPRIMSDAQPTMCAGCRRVINPVTVLPIGADEACRQKSADVGSNHVRSRRHVSLCVRACVYVCVSHCEMKSQGNTIRQLVKQCLLVSITPYKL